MFANTLELPVLTQVWDYFFLRGILSIFRVALAIFHNLESSILSSRDIGALFQIFKEGPKSLVSFSALIPSIRKFPIDYAILQKLRRSHAKDVYLEHEEKQYKNRQTQIPGLLLDEGVRGKFLGKLYLFNGLSKLRGNGCLPKEVLEDFDEEVVAGTSCDPGWPICLYDLFYKSKIQRHFAFRTEEKITLVEDHFGNGEESEEIFERAEDFEDEEEPEESKSDDSPLDGVLLERNKHICNKDFFEAKFKLLYANKNDEFFVNAMQNLYEDQGDESYKTKINDFLEV